MDPGPDGSKLVEVLRGADAVVFAAGVASVWQSHHGTTLYSEGGANVLRAMKAAGVTKLVAVTSEGVTDDPSQRLIYRWVVKPLLMAKMYEDMKLLEAAIQAAGDWLQWAIVRPSRLMDGPVGRPAWIGEGPIPPGSKVQVDRADVAALIVACLEGGQRWGKLLTITA